jgi:hypothetical protein
VYIAGIRVPDEKSQIEMLRADSMHATIVSKSHHPFNVHHVAAEDETTDIQSLETLVC